LPEGKSVTAQFCFILIAMKVFWRTVPGIDKPIAIRNPLMKENYFPNFLEFFAALNQ